MTGLPIWWQGYNNERRLASRYHVVIIQSHASKDGKDRLCVLSSHKSLNVAHKERTKLGTGAGIIECSFDPGLNDGGEVWESYHVLWDCKMVPFEDPVLKELFGGDL